MVTGGLNSFRLWAVVGSLNCMAVADAGHLFEESNYLTRGCKKRIYLPWFPVARIVDSSFDSALLQLLRCQAERRAQQRVWLGRKTKSSWGARTWA